MTNWRRAYVPGGTFFFTLVTEHRAPILTTPHGRTLLRKVTLECRRRWPFEIVAMALLPDHLHTVWRLPPGDSEYSTRWAWLKKEFTKHWISGSGLEQATSESRRRNRRRGVLQRRFWEHSIRNETDFERHVDYIHYNPVKHGYVTCPADWQWSSFHGFVRNGVYPKDWGCAPMEFDDIADSVGE